MFISQKSRNFAHVIELDRHIEILLLSNDCVIVPDLGGFMTHHVEARYDEDDCIFLPPLRTLGFNPQLTMNDSLLAQSYVEAYDLSYPEALRRIEEEVNELKQHIETEGFYELNDIGTLSVNEDGKYLFNPCEAGILTPALYGLSSFEMKPVKAQAIAITKKESATKASAKTIAKPAALSSTKDEELPVAKEIDINKEKEPEVVLEEEQEEERTIIIKMSWIRNAVAVAAAVLAFFLMTTPVSNSESTLAISNLNSPIIAGMMPKDSNIEKISIEKKVEAQPTAVAPDTTTIVKKVQQACVTDTQPQSDAKQNSVTPVVESKKDIRYCIVLASYVSKKNAHTFVEELQKKGYKESEVFIRNEVTRVIYGNFKSPNDAYNKLHSIHKQKGLEEAWVMKI